jgi:hypothetical protein
VYRGYKNAKSTFQKGVSFPVQQDLPVMSNPDFHDVHEGGGWEE